MTAIRWFQTGASPWGNPATGRAFRRHPVFLLVLAVATLSQTGCASGPLGSCGKCGGVGSRMRTMSERVFRPFRCGKAGGCSTCGAGGGLGAEAPPVQYGTPSVVAPAPLGSGTTVVPNATDSFPSGLDPIPSETRPSESRPSSTPGPPPASESSPSTGAKSSTGKANYEAFRPRSRDGQRRSGALARSLDANPEPTPRSAQGLSPTNGEPNPLDNLPPLDIPRDQSRSGESPPVPPAAQREADPTTTPVAASPPETLADLAAREASRASGELTVAPGIRRIAGVENKLAGGSLPNARGLDWLSEKGYKTILDLREDGDISAAFIADVARRGLRYIALPIRVKTVDHDHVSRFHFEVSLADARPLYFCDTDGTRAGVMWYIRRVKVDNVDRQVARHDAEELGLTGGPLLQAADAYLDGRNPTPTPVPAPTPAAAPKSNSEATPAPPPAPLAGSNENAPPVPGAGPPPGPSADAGRAEVFRDPATWKSMAALMLTGLGVPLAYLSRSALPAGFRALTRASLPAPRHSPRSLPGASDV